MSIYEEERLAQNRQNSTAETTIYTVPATTKTLVKQALLCNTTSSSANYSLSIVPSGGAAGDDNKILKVHPLPANSTTAIDVSQVMYTGDFISILQGTAGAVTIIVSGIEKDIS